MNNSGQLNHCLHCPTHKFLSKGMFILANKERYSIVLFIVGKIFDHYKIPFLEGILFCLPGVLFCSSEKMVNF